MPRIFQPRETPESVVCFRKRLGATIRRWREERACFSRSDLATAVGCSAKTVERWESGASSPRMEELFLMEQLASGLVAAARETVAKCLLEARA